jgi:uncharacterized membrane protein YdjX (TVP38/TMEM64 family)
MMKRYIKLFVFALLLGIAWLLFRYFNIGDYFTLAKIQGERVHLSTLVEQNYLRAVLVYMLIYIAIIAGGFPVVAPLTLVGGFLFGAIYGTLYASVAATIGTTLTFLVVRYLIAHTLRGKYGVKLEKFNERLKSYGHSYLLTMNLMGLIPFFVIATLAGLTDVSIITFAWTAFFGSLPLIAIYAFAGKQLGTMTSFSDIFSPQIIIAFILLGLIALIPMIIRRFKELIDI